MTTMTQTNPIYKRGDVILVLYPDSNLLTAKRRPAFSRSQTEFGNAFTQRGAKREIDCSTLR
jgi:hypothetical protein